MSLSTPCSSPPISSCLESASIVKPVIWTCSAKNWPWVTGILLSEVPIFSKPGTAYTLSKYDSLVYKNFYNKSSKSTEYATACLYKNITDAAIKRDVDSGLFGFFFENIATILFVETLEEVLVVWKQLWGKLRMHSSCHTFQVVFLIFLLFLMQTLRLIYSNWHLVGVVRGGGIISPWSGRFLELSAQNQFYIVTLYQNRIYFWQQFQKCLDF